MRKLSLFKALLVAVCLLGGSNFAWGQTIYTWDFSSSSWSGKNFATGSAVSFNTSAETPTGSDKYVTFLFESDGAAYMKNKNTTILWYKKNGSATTNNVSVIVPAGYKVTLDMYVGSNTRPVNYTYSGISSTFSSFSTSISYENGSENDEMFTIWATNTVRTSGNNTEYMNGIRSITLSPISSYTWDFTNPTIWNTLTKSDNKYACDGSAAISGKFVYFKGDKLVYNQAQSHKGIGFSATTASGIPTDNYLKITVPVGYKATVTCATSSNRTVRSYFNANELTFNASGSSSKEYDNTTGVSDVDLYLYCSANAGGTGQYPHVESIVLQQYCKMTTNYIYNDGENDYIVKTAKVDYVAYGNEYILPYDETIYDTENHYTYTYSSGALTIGYVTTDAENIIYYTRAASVNYTLNVIAKYGANSVKIVDSESIEAGSTKTYYFPAYYLSGTTLYAAPENDGDSNDSDGLTYGGIVTVTSNTDIELTYVEDGNAIFFGEFETLATSAVSNLSTNNSNRTFFSNGQGRSLQAKSTSTSNAMSATYSFNVPMTGVYKVVMPYYNGNNRDRTTVVTVDLGEENAKELLNASIAANGGSGTVDSYVLLTEGNHTITVAGTYNLTAEFDYILVRKITNGGEILGAVDYTTNYYSAWNSNPVWINAGETGYYKIRNWNNTASANLYENWYLFAANESSENLVIFGPNHSNTATNGTYNSKPTFTMADLNGATVELYFKLTDAGDGTYTWTTTAVTTKADGTKLSPDLVYTQTGINVSKMKAHVSVEKSWLEVVEQRVYTIGVPLGSAGFATFANHDYALDFTDVEGLKAFTATVNGDVVTFTPATLVPAGTGLLLKGAEGSYDVPVVASADAIASNVLYAPTTAVSGLNYDAGGYYNYILSKPAGKSIGFYRANNNSVAVGKAYLRIEKALGAREFTFIGFDDNSVVTGISEMSNEKLGMINGNEGMKDSVYDLQGRRVTLPTKGLYIINGKKVVY